MKLAVICPENTPMSDSSRTLDTADVLTAIFFYSYINI